MYELTKRISKEYWPADRVNSSADRERGDAAVDKLTLGELHAFFSECTTGPTYCLVYSRVSELLRAFPPHIENKRARAVAAMDSARLAYGLLKEAVEST